MTAINPQAIRGPVTAVPVVAGNGVRFVEDVENNRVVAEADETVLWDGAGSTINTSLNITLSEAFTNFERVRFVFARTTLPVSTEYMTSGNSQTVMVLENTLVGTNNSIVIDTATLNLSGTAVTCTAFSRKTLGDTTISTSTSYPMSLYQVVGINRVSASA